MNRYTFISDCSGSPIKGLGNTFLNAGKGLIDAFVNGIKSAGSKVKDAIGNIGKQARDMLPFSDAKKGPLSELTASGKALPATLAKGIKANIRPLSHASEQAALAAKPTPEAPDTPLPDGIARRSSSSSTVVTVNVDARGVSDPNAVGTAVADELRSVLPR